MKIPPIHINRKFYIHGFKKGIYLVLQHVNRIPPHIGLLIENKYHSLQIRGKELNVDGNVLLKNILIRKIPCIFLEISPHPVFSPQHQEEVYLEIMKNFTKVDGENETCLSPLREFFEEFYKLPKQKTTLIFDLLDQLYLNSFVKSAAANFVETTKDNYFYLQPYNQDILLEKINNELNKIDSGVKR